MYVYASQLVVPSKVAEKLAVEFHDRPLLIS